MGGFKPSRSDIAGSTVVGSDKDVDSHQFTGSVDITGSLLINGVQITQNGGGGGGGSPGGANTQVQFNDNGSFGGSADLTFDGTRLITTQMTASTSIKAAALQVSSSVEGALFRVDHSTQAGSKPIIFVTGSGLVGVGTDAPRTDTGDTNRLHILGESGADQGQDPVANTLLMLENNDHVGVQFMTPIDKSGFLCWGDADAARVAHFYFHHSDNLFHFDGNSYGHEAMTIRASGDSVNMGTSNSAHMLTDKAALHISSSTGGTDVGGPVLLRVDHGDQPEPVLFVTGSGQVGIGTEAPDTTLQVLSTSTQQKWSYDADSFATLTVADGGDTTLSSSESGNIILDADDIRLQSNGGQVKVDRPGGSTRLQFDVSTSTSLIDNPNNNDIAFRLGTGLKELARLDQSEGALLMSGTFSSPGGDAAINFRDTATKINSPGSNRLAITAPTLEVTGTLSVEKDTDATAFVGRANIGAVASGVSDYAYFSHIDQAGVNTYALEQRANGTTSVNAPSGGQIYFRLGNVSTAMIIDGTSNNNIGINGTPSARLHVQTNSPEKDVFRCDGDENHILFVSGSGRVGILSAAPAQTLSVSGSAAFSGTYGSTAVETRSTNLDTLTATDGVAIIDLTSAATNTSFAFFIDNGTYIGQEKIVYVKTIVGADGNNSNDAALQGSNIDSPLGNANGTLSLSASDQGEGFFGMNRGAARLLWDGTDWAPISVTNLSWS